MVEPILILSDGAVLKAAQTDSKVLASKISGIVNKSEIEYKVEAKAIINEINIAEAQTIASKVSGLESKVEIGYEAEARAITNEINVAEGQGIKSKVSDEISKANESSYTSLRALMSPEEVARYDEHWCGVAKNISNEAIDKKIVYIKNGGITKPAPGCGAFKPAKISAAVDMNTGDIYFGYNGISKFSPSKPSSGVFEPELQTLIDKTKNKAANDLKNSYASRESYEIWSVDNCAEVFATNNALSGGADIDNIFLNAKFFSSGEYAKPCTNCEITFENFKMP